MITKIQKLSAIHNALTNYLNYYNVVYDYKDTEIVSNSQRYRQKNSYLWSCL